MVKPHAFTNIDAQEEPSRWVHVLDHLRRDSFYTAYKTRLMELLYSRPGDRYLEVGSGTGDDARGVGSYSGATVVCLDLSLTMAREARLRGSQAYVVGDAHALPFASGIFDGCWSDRTFQHLATPAYALDEIVRVLKPGCSLVVVDPDYGTQAMDFPDQTLAQKVFRFRAERGLRNGTLAHRMTSLFLQHGLLDVCCEEMVLEVRDHTAIDNVMGLRTWARSACLAGDMSEVEVAKWEGLFDETVAAGTFRYAVSFFITKGTKFQA